MADGNAEVSYISDSESDFSGFGPEDIGAFNEDFIGDIGDSDISAISDFEEDSIASESEEDDDVPDWTDELEPVDLQPFIQATRSTHSLPATATERDFFSLFVPVDFVQLMTDETNRYASQQQTTASDRHWHSTTLAEMYAFLGLLIYMGLMVAADVDFYWSCNDFLGIKGFKDVMPAKRFHKLMQYLHLNNNDNDTNEDKLFKVRPLLDTVLSTFETNFRPNQNQSTDEGMIAYRGRFGAKQYMPSKPIKWGLKVWMRCDSKSGYCHQFDIYMGKENQPGSKTLAQRVVESLTCSLRGKYYHIYFDSFFTSVRLVKSLLRHGLYACGTVVKTRKGLPTNFRNHPHLMQGQFITKQDRNLVATVWQDKKPVAFLSTNADPQKTDSTTRRQKDGTMRIVERPEATSLYQQHFRGVDICDQLRSSYDVGRPSKKWWKYIMNFVLNLCIINAYLVMCNSEVNLPVEKKRYRQINFRMRLAQQLINGFSSTRRAPHHPTHIYGHIHADPHDLVRLNRKRSTCKPCMHRTPKKKEETPCMAAEPATFTCVPGSVRLSFMLKSRV